MTTKTFLLSAILSACTFASISAQNYSVYVSDAGNFSNPPWQILKFDANGQNGQVFISQNLDWPQDILFLENENTVLVSNLNNGRITQFNANTGAHLGEFATGIGGPTRMKLGPDSLLYVLQWTGNGKVWRYKLSGAFVDEFTATGVTTSIGLAWDDSGNLYVSSYNGKFIRKFSPSGADLGNFISTNLAGPTNIWFAENGDLMVVDYLGNSIKRFDSQGNYKGIFISGLPQGEGVDFLPNGNILIGSGGTSSVRVYSDSGILLNNLVPPGTLNLKVPNAVVVRSLPVSSISELYEEWTFVTPTLGTLFQFSSKEMLLGMTACTVYNSSGAFVQTINFADSSSWDASNLPVGVYHLIAKNQDGVIGRQTVVVQR